MGAKLLSLNPFRKNACEKKSSAAMLGSGGMYISGQKGYEKADTVPVVVIDEEKKKRTKPGAIRFITNFLADNIKNKKNESFYSPVIKR